MIQPDNVSMPGSHNSEIGCAGDWQPDCDQAQLALDAEDEVWKQTVTLPAGSYAYKAAIDKSWDENYGAGGIPNGSDIPLDLAAPQDVSLLLRPRDALGHDRRQRPDHHRARQLPERARVFGRLGARLHAIVAPGSRR